MQVELLVNRTDANRSRRPGRPCSRIPDAAAPERPAGALETNAEELAARVVDLVTPIGKGQRGLIVSPPRAGKTVLLQRLALAIKQNHPECYLIVLLIDERPGGSDRHGADGGRPVERRGGGGSVRRAVVGARPRNRRHRPGKGQASALRTAARRGAAARLDPRLLHAFRGTDNAEAPSGKHAVRRSRFQRAMQKPESGFFSAARNVEEGGSLTILATALIDTGSPDG